MDEQLRQAVLGEADKRSVTTNKDKRWKNGIVPYVFDPHIGKINLQAYVIISLIMYVPNLAL